MSIEEFLSWGAILHYPRLLLGSKGELKPGREEWELLRYDATGRLDFAIARLNMMLRRVAREKAEASK